MGSSSIGWFEMIRQIRLYKKVIDGQLKYPASWSGEIRRELLKEIVAKEENRALGDTFNWLIKRSIDDEKIFMNADFLKEIHVKLTGVGEFRNTGVRIGRFRDFPHSSVVERLVDSKLELFWDSSFTIHEICELKLELLSIHPFADGNGRTIRLLCSFLLMKLGYRSTLFTAFEQHYYYNPKEYGIVLSQFRSNAINREAVIHSFLNAVIQNTKYAAWFFLRKRSLSDICTQQGIEKDEQEKIILNFDTNPAYHPKNIFKKTEPLYKILYEMNPVLKLRFKYQLSRILEETLVK